jgi:hypothetical protein
LSLLFLPFLLLYFSLVYRPPIVRLPFPCCLCARIFQNYLGWLAASRLFFGSRFSARQASGHFGRANKKQAESADFFPIPPFLLYILCSFNLYYPSSLHWPPLYSRRVTPLPPLSNLPLLMLFVCLCVSILDFGHHMPSHPSKNVFLSSSIHSFCPIIWPKFIFRNE